MQATETFGSFLAESREKNGYNSQRQLATASGLSNGTIARIEAGTQKASPETLKTLSEVLNGVSYEQLMEKAGYLGVVFKGHLPPITARCYDPLQEEVDQLREERDFARRKAEEAWKEFDDFETAIEHLKQELELTKGQLFAKDHSERKYRDAINELVADHAPLVAELDEKNKVLEWYATEENYDQPLIVSSAKGCRLARSDVQKDGGNKALEVLLHYKSLPQANGTNE